MPKFSHIDSRPLILLIPNVSWWILGEMASRIASRFQDRFRFLILPESVLLRRPELAKRLFASVDLIHCMNESSVPIVVNSGVDHAPMMSWIHHVTSWSTEHSLSAKYSEAIIACTEEWKSELQRRVPTQRFEVIQLGVDSSFFKPVSRDRRRWGIPEGSFVVGFLGAKSSDRDKGRKGTDTLREVIAKVSARVPNLHILLCGPGWEQDVASFRQMGIAITSTGYIRKTDLPAAYAAMDAYLMTSRVEGGPVTVLEAMACERPPFATRVGLVPSVIQDGVNGFSFEPGDANAIAEALVSFSQSRDRHNVGRKARNTVLGRTWDVTLEPLGRIYAELIRRPAATDRFESEVSLDDLSRRGAAADVLLQAKSAWKKRNGHLLDRVKFTREIMSGFSLSELIQGGLLVKGS